MSDLDALPRRHEATFVIAGRLPPADQPDKTKSLELFRGNSRAVSIITFDEVRASLGLLRDLLSDEPSATDPSAEPS